MSSVRTLRQRRRHSNLSGVARDFTCTYMGWNSPCLLTTSPLWSVKEVKEESWLNSEISQLRECITTGEWDNAPPQYKAVRKELSTLGKLVLRGTRLLIPAKLRDRVVDLAHKGHQGLTKTKQRLRSKVWWVGIDRQVEAKCKTYHSCQLVGLPTPPEPLKHTEFPSQPWQDLAPDLMGSLPPGEYVYVVIDYYGRYFEVDILKSVTSRSAPIIGSLQGIFIWLFCRYTSWSSAVAKNR